MFCEELEKQSLTTHENMTYFIHDLLSALNYRIRVGRAADALPPKESSTLIPIRAISRASRLQIASSIGRNTHRSITLPTTMSDEDDNDVSYGNVHRAFLQALLARQSITLEEAKPLIAKIETAANPNREVLAGDISQADLDNYIHTLNDNISFFDLEIRSTQHRSRNQRVYALVNTTSDALTQMSTIHTADEIAFVKRVLDAMFETNNTPQREVMAITSNQALRLAKPTGEEARRLSSTQGQSQNAGLTMAQAEKMMEDMESEGWFELSANGFYSLSPRALMELRGWLKDTYNDPDDEVDEEDDDDHDPPHKAIKDCQGCKEIVTVGQRCPRMECDARVHNHCKAGMFRIHAGAEQCPKCKTAWVDAPPVGEKAARRGRDSHSNVNGNGRKKTSGMGMDGANDDDDDDDSDAVGGA